MSCKDTPVFRGFVRLSHGKGVNLGYFRVQKGVICVSAQNRGIFRALLGKVLTNPCFLKCN